MINIPIEPGWIMDGLFAIVIWLAKSKWSEMTVAIKELIGRVGDIEKQLVELKTEMKIRNEE